MLAPAERVVLVFLCAGLGVDGVLLLRMIASRFRWPSRSVAFMMHPWRLPDLGLLASVALLLPMVVYGWSSILYLLGYPPDFLPAQYEMLRSILILHVPVIALVMALARLRGVPTVQVFGFGAGGWAWKTLLGVILCLAVLPMVVASRELYCLLLTSTHVAIEEQPVVTAVAASASASWWVKALLVIMTGLAVPVAEELVFRGVALPVLSDRLGTGAAVLAVSLLFAVLHITVVAYVPLFVLSVGLSLAYICTGSILVVIVMHSAFNLISVALTMSGEL